VTPKTEENILQILPNTFVTRSQSYDRYIVTTTTPRVA
jgi:hypothetical protein